MGLLGPFPPLMKKRKIEPLNPAARDPDHRVDSVFQAGMFVLIALGLGVRFGPDIWHLFL